jgi:hypothetical protein
LISHELQNMRKKANTETTEKESGSPTLTRVRDNQRRSRARRKEYIQHLEQRLRSFESQGVVASQEIQQAGRKVARENSLRRSLLLLRGVTQDEIEDFLKSHAEYTPRVMLGSTSAISRPVTPHDGLPIDLGFQKGLAMDKLVFCLRDMRSMEPGPLLITNLSKSMRISIHMD